MKRQDHTIEDCRAAVAAWEDAQPVHLGCGCLADVHPATIAAIREAHPHVWGLDLSTEAPSFYHTDLGPT